MSLKELDLDISYKSRGDGNLADALVVPALRESIMYKRSAGYFSSSVFELLKSGIETFLLNDGEIRLICSPQLDEDDIEAINQGYKLKNEIQKEKFDKDVYETISEMDDDNLAVLIELIKNNKMNVVIAEMKDDRGIFHDKTGILIDDDNNKVAFVGSPNETKSGYFINYEKIRIFASWIDGDLRRVEDEERDFDLIWDGKDEYIETVDCNDIIIEYVKKEAEKRNMSFKPRKKGIKLRPYQEEAIKAWEDNGNKGFFVMATGTGKTWTAIYAALNRAKEDKLFLVICAPYKHLLKQWSYDVKDVFDDADIILVSSENPKWENELKDSVYSSNFTKPKNIIVISTIMSFETERFQKVLDKVKTKKMLIVDEAHNFKTDDEAIVEKYDYVLGLSATPTKDPSKDDGHKLMDYFGGKVYDLPIDFAIDKEYLVKYNYYPIFVNATPEEESEYKMYSARIASCFNERGVCIDPEKAYSYSQAKNRVIAMAEEKMNRIGEIFSKVKEKDHFIVYCGDGRIFDENKGEELRHIEYVIKELEKRGFKPSQFTASESMSERMNLIDMFNKGTIDSLVAIRCLDEGINIPSIDGALILASANDYRQTVQRRGRILRTFTNAYTDKKKEYANIYDVIVLPSLSTTQMAETELKRMNEYLRLAKNRDDYLSILDDYCDEYGIDLNKVEENDIEKGELDE